MVFWPPCLFATDTDWWEMVWVVSECGYKLLPRHSRATVQLGVAGETTQKTGAGRFPEKSCQIFQPVLVQLIFGRRFFTVYFPTLTCGVFVFSSVSAASPARPPPHSLTSLTHSLNVHFAWQAWHNLHCQGVGCTPWRPLGLRLFCVAGVGQSALPRGRMYALASLGSPPLLRGRRGTMCTAKGSDVRPGVPWVSASFAWQAWHNVHCQGVGCTPWRPLGLRLFCVSGVAQCALPRGGMYALASLGSPPLLRGRRGTMCTAKGSDVRPGVPWVSASFAWQAWHNVHCQGVGCTPWRPLGLRLFCVAGVAQCALPRGRMYALASLGSPPLLRGRRGTMCILRGRRGTMCTAKGSDVRPGVPWAPPLLRGRRGTMCTAKGVGCTPWRPLGSASFVWQAWDNVHFTWQAWDNVHCQGVGCTPWRPLGSASFAWQAWDNVHCQGVGVRPGVPWAPPLLRGRRSLIHSLSHSLSHSTHSLTLTHSHSLTRSLSLTNTHLLTYSLTDTLSHTHTLNDRWMDGWTLT